MKNNYKNLLFGAVAAIMSIGTAAAQCTFTTPYSSSTISNYTGCSTGTLTSAIYAGEYRPITFNSLGVYVFNCTGGVGNYLTFTDATNTVIKHGLPPLTVTVTTAGIYRMHVAASAACGTEALGRTLSYAMYTPTVTGTGASRCGAGSANLTATGSAPIYWYATPTSTNHIAVGSPYTTPTVAANTTYYAAANYAEGDLNTGMLAGNGSNGNMFDVIAKNNIRMTGVDMNINGTGTHTVEVWYRTGTFVSFESANTGWTNVFTGTVSSLGTGSFTPVNFTTQFNVAATSTIGMYVTINGGPGYTNYTNGTAVGNLLAQNGDIRVNEGKGGGYFGVTISTRNYNGVIKYNKAGCVSPRVPVTLTVNPTPTVNVATTNTVLCLGNTATLTASGAATYTWSGIGAAQSIVVSPSVNTTYSVTATSSAGCTGSASFTQTVSACTGVESLLAENGSVSVYPNPNNGVFYVNIGYVTNNSYIEVYDALGNLVIKQLLTANENKVNTGEVASGVYFYKVVNGNDLLRHGKLIKE